MCEISNKNNANLKEIISVLPVALGVYQFIGKDNEIIYIGKAKNLKNRVSSYFLNKHDNRKTAILVKNIIDIKYIVVESEQDALLLENNLIKKYQPRYNIRLKDDKSYPWICIKNEPFPRIFKTRTLIRDGSKFFGPYTSVYMVNTLLNLFRSEYKLRNCNYKLTEENIRKKKFRVCLEYHIGNCSGPCENLISEEDYNKRIDEIINILRGNLSGVIKHLRHLMELKAQNMNFEEAGKIKDKYDSLKRYQSKSTVVSSQITDVDVFAIDQDKKYAYINYLKVIDGAIIQTYTQEIKKILDESVEDLLMTGIVEIRSKIFSNAKEILLPFHLKNVFKDITFKVPQRGDKKKLVQLSLRNAKYFKIEKEKRRLQLKIKKDQVDILKMVQKDLHLPEIPYTIECFDNSNLQGSNPVAACVVFKNGLPLRSEYRHYNIKTVKGPDDFASMEEVVYRRYRHLLEENILLPQLVIIDGGKGQLSSAVKALNKLSIESNISIISIAKRLEYIYFPGKQDPIIINKESETIKLIQQLRNEAHRFGISFHRNKRSKILTSSELSEIKGIGRKTAEKLLLKFKSVKNIKETNKEKLSEVVGTSKARLIFDYFH